MKERFDEQHRATTLKAQNEVASSSEDLNKPLKRGARKLVEQANEGYHQNLG